MSKCKFQVSLAWVRALKYMYELLQAIAYEIEVNVQKFKIKHFNSLVDKGLLYHLFYLVRRSILITLTTMSL